MKGKSTCIYMYIKVTDKIIINNAEKIEKDVI